MPIARGRSRRPCGEGLSVEQGRSGVRPSSRRGSSAKRKTLRSSGGSWRRWGPGRWTQFCKAPADSDSAAPTGTSQQPAGFGGSEKVKVRRRRGLSCPRNVCTVLGARRGRVARQPSPWPLPSCAIARLARLHAFDPLDEQDSCHPGDFAGWSARTPHDAVLRPVSGLVDDAALRRRSDGAGKL